MKKLNNGFSLIELLVVISIFAIVLIITTQSLVVTLQNSRKSESIVDVRTNLNFVLSKIERSLYNAETIETCQSNTISFTDNNDTSSIISCYADPTSGWVKYNDENITSDSVSVTYCNFSCTTSSSAPTSINISLTGTSNVSTGAEGAGVTVSSVVQLRVY